MTTDSMAPRRIQHYTPLRAAVACIAMTALLGCQHATIHDGTTVMVPSGRFVMGSGSLQRGTAVELSVRAGTYGPDTAQALRAELSPRTVDVEAFSIMARPVTNDAYYSFVLATGAPEPFIDPTMWASAQTGYQYAAVQRVLWERGKPRPQRAQHPVVLITRDDAEAYCAWWGKARAGSGQLPTETQWEKAARGTDGRAFPWGDHFDPALVNSAESGRGSTVAVGTQATAASPYGVLDMAGNVFEWTRSTWIDTDGAAGGIVVKGGAFNADAASARAAARHPRPAGLQHPAIGFRCVVERPTSLKTKKT